MARILVVDDNEAMLKVMAAILERANHQVTSASDGRAALKLLSRETPDLLVTDLIMPEMEGVELIREVRKRAPALPILSVSGGGRIDPHLCLKLAEKVGANAVLIKPFPAAKLSAAVSSLLAPASA